MEPYRFDLKMKLLNRKAFRIEQITQKLGKMETKKDTKKDNLS